MQEIWKDIKGYEGLYQVSNLGNVRNLKQNKNLSKIDNGNGYLYITLRNKGKRKNHYIHRLVAENFIENFDKNKVINHKDYNKKNNNINNLENITQRENIIYSLKHKPKLLFCKTNTGEHHITKRKNIYRVIINKKEYSCRTLEEAIILRNNLIDEFEIDERIRKNEICS